MGRKGSQTGGFAGLGIFGEGQNAIWVEWRQDDGQARWRSLYSSKNGYQTFTIKAKTYTEAKLEVRKSWEQRQQEKLRQLILI